MNIISRVRTMDKKLRVMLIASALLLLPVIGLFMSWADVARDGRYSDLAIFFRFTAIFIVPTSLILSVAILSGLRHNWREHLALAVLGALNVLVALGVIWFLAAS